MDNQHICLLFVILVCISTLCYGQYQIPEVTFEAFRPKGLRISIPADNGVELFGFHGKINKPILQIEPGEISQDVTKPTNGRFSYVDTNLQLKENDVINYWVFVQHDQLGFRKDEQSWTVDRLLPQEDLQKGTVESCNTPSVTKVEGETRVCPGDTIIDYRFSNNQLDSRIWLTEKYIPGDPDWPFNIYQNTPDIIGIENDVLRIKPTLVEENFEKEIDLSSGCTRREKECRRNSVYRYNPPVVSGKLQSKKSFCFANVTIRAKLPIGDYIFPEIYLQDMNSPSRRILIAYARGNRDYIGSGGTDDGGKKLFGGPYTAVTEPSKSKYLSTYLSDKHIGESWHTFNLIWRPDKIEMYIDGTQFGTRDAGDLQATGFNKEKLVRLFIGVGVGGAFEFPDGYTSSGQEKPYSSASQYSTKQFVANKNTWLRTWTKDSQLQVDYVSVTAI